jgi:hypothetical protein
MKNLLVVFLFGTLTLNALAQDENPASADKSVSHGKFSLEYASNSVYNGRKDSLATPYLTPTLGYFAASGFFVEGSASYLTRAGAGRIDLFALDAGYDFSIHGVDVEIGANRSFYNSQSTNVKSEVQGSLTASAAYDFGFIRPTLGGGIDFGTSSDYLASLGLEHSFQMMDDQLEIVPTFLTNASTQNFYGNYYSKRKYGKLKRKNGSGIYYDISADLSEASAFKILDYEWSLPINYTINNFTLSFTPTYVMATNPATVTVHIKPSIGSAVISKTFTEKLSNTFYGQFQVSFRF